ncbi:DUF4102 domain-containing protein [Burkholderia metallica]|uniref:Arm DNA-binding domain-containing protein n=1 Tax=Burkholderia metallica TaxID=488729 RepID=UPI00157ACD48|nr:DUF4102 domain-containing protein [Burkholderia metallica]
MGTCPDISLSEAREKALRMRELIDNGQDPIDERNQDRLPPCASSSLKRWIGRVAHV